MGGPIAGVALGPWLGLVAGTVLGAAHVLAAPVNGVSLVALSSSSRLGFLSSFVLYALCGAGINKEEIAKAAAFLVGACSCKVKRECPGVDLLLTADWDALAEGRKVADPQPPMLASMRGSSSVRAASSGSLTWASS